MRRFLMIACLLLTAACSKEPQDKCGFKMSKHEQRLTWGNTVPVRLDLSQLDPVYHDSMEQAASIWNEAANRVLVCIDCDSRAMPVPVIFTELNKNETGRAKIRWVNDTIIESFIGFSNTHNFYLDQGNDGFHFLSIAVHELGHTLGLDHSDDKSSVMYPISPKGHHYNLSTEDINNLNCGY